MAVKGITIDTLSSASPHIYSYDQALINNGIIGGDAVHEMFDNLLATKVSNNIVTISPGVFSIQGHFANVVYGTTEPMTIENGTAGQKRNDLICAKFKRTVDTDEISLVVVKGMNHPTAPVDPTYIARDLTTTGTERLFPLYRLPLDGITLGTPVQLFTVQKNLNGFKDSLAPKVIDGWTVQDVNGFRTATLSANVIVNAMTYSAANGVWIAAESVVAPSSPRFLSSENIAMSVIGANIVSGHITAYNRSTGLINFSYFSATDRSGTPITVQFKITGKI